MTRETKIGLLLGMGVILLIGIIVSDQLTQRSDPADFTRLGPESQRSIDTSDAAPVAGYAGNPAPGPGSGLRVAPGFPGSPGSPNLTTPGQPAGTSPVIEPPSNFFIPTDRLPSAVSPRQANRSPGSPTATNQPLPAYNVGEAPGGRGVSRNSARDGVPTLRLGQSNTEQPYRTAVPPSINSRPTNVPAPRGADSVIRHTVLKGETLTKIAQRYYGNGDFWRTLKQANPGKVTPSGQVRSGAVLNIPKRNDAVRGLDAVLVGSEHSIRVDHRAAERPGKTIEVRAGDTLSELATKYLGSATRWQALLEANSDKLDDPQGLQVGMKLRLPSTADSGQATANSAQRSSTPTSHSGKTYTVRPGDNLTEIAEKTLGDGSKWQMVYQANRDKLKSPDRLIVGQELRIPAPG